MRAQRVFVLMSFIVTLVGCGGQDYHTPTNPSPVPSGTTQSPPASGGAPASSISIPSGAVSLGSNAFGSSPLSVPAGTILTWTNTDSLPHTSTANGGAWDSGTIAPGGSYSVALSQTGTFQYHCTIHPGMIGTVNVQ